MWGRLKKPCWSCEVEEGLKDLGGLCEICFIEAAGKVGDALKRDE